MKKELYDYYVIERAHRALRKRAEDNLAEAYSAQGLCDEERVVRRFEYLISLETPRIHEYEKIVFLRSVSNLPPIYTDAEWAEKKKKHYIHELGFVSNLCPDYAGVISVGLLEKRKCADEYGKRMIDAIISLTDRYCECAKNAGREDVAEILSRVPRYPARNFREALQFFRILHFALWLEGDYHNTVGRFDKYMYPYFKADMDKGVYTRAEALELIEDFFLSFNKDSDLYVGVQQGDNGQSMVLGGIDENGYEVFSTLSELCLEASRNLKVIDPKINLRVSKNTPISVYEKGTELTAVGLGFPQYSNDDVVIDGLVRLGYTPEDAANYVVAACWEFITSGNGNDIANIGAVNFPKIVDTVIRKHAGKCSFDELLLRVREECLSECEKIIEPIKDVWFIPAPFMELLRHEKKYNNFGLHGCGIASAADALAAVEKYIYIEKSLDADTLISALDTDFAQNPELLHKLRYEAPKMGADSPRADELCGVLLDAFADALDGKKNCLGGIWRAGTGTAMYYLWQAAEIGATADGRRKGEPFGTNFSPNLFTKISGPVSDIISFTANDLTRNINGGPLTLELASSVFSDSESVGKVAALIKFFIERGGHQLQLNAVNENTLRAAQKNPDAYRQLIVRIWGWSAYFVELDEEYQNHVLSRQIYSV